MATLEESYGRTRHDIELLNTLLTVGSITIIDGDAIQKGYAKQREKTIKTLLSNIFRKSTKSQLVKARGCACAVITPTGTLNIPPGYVTDMYFGTFPYITTVILTNGFGQRAQFNNVGNPEFS